jgi:hypothetical protein
MQDVSKIAVQIASEFTGSKAFKQAETASQKLEKRVARLGKQLLALFAVNKITAFGKASVRAFAADEKAARSLSLALANTGNAFASIEVEKFIGDLQRTTGVLDDQLRPAFRTLLTATSDVKKSQDGLALALDIAAGTGKDLGAVSMALAKAYGGQTTALSRLGAGLSKATLASGDMDLITSELTKKFSGQALAAADGYSGSIDRLTVASENAKEIIGKDLLDSLALLSGPGGITKATTQMEGLATEIGNVVYGLAALTNKVKGLFNIKGFNLIALIPGIGGLFGPGGVFEKLSDYGASEKTRAAGNPAQSPGQRAAIDKANKDAIKLQRQQNDLKKIDNANTTRKLVLTADQQALEELKKKFDVERIGLFAALNNATDQETQMRLKSLIAIKDNDTALAGKIKAEDEAAEAARRFTNALLGQAAMIADMEAARSAIGLKSLTSGASGNTSMMADTSLNAGNYTLGDIADTEAARSRIGAASINYTINASGIGDQQIAAVVQNAIQDLNRYGSSTTYAGAI